MKFISFNINSIRGPGRIDQLNKIVENYQPDIIGLQEIKVHSDMWPDALVEHLDYHIYHFGQKSYHGVAILTKKEPVNVQYNFPNSKEDDQRRLIAIDLEDTQYGNIRIINGYFPQGDNIHHETKFPLKRAFYHDLFEYLKNTPKGYNVVLMGDFNICPEDVDIDLREGRSKEWLRTGKCSFQPEEREWMAKLFSMGFVDSYRYKYFDEKKSSWFDYRSNGFDVLKGLRIDLILVTPGLLKHYADAGIDHDIRAMESPSDHCPVWLELK